MNFHFKGDIYRNYRSLAAGDLIKYRVLVGESDLMVMSDQDLSHLIKNKLKYYRCLLKEYIYINPIFKDSLQPLPVTKDAPEIVRWMLEASSKANVGPMAAVAGAISGSIGHDFASKTNELIIENGGDIFIKSRKTRLISIFAGNSPLSNKVGIKVLATQGLGVCTSAGTVGPSLSFGKADAVVIISPDVALADAVATATANMVSSSSDFERAITFAQSIPSIVGIALIKDDKLAVWGDLELAPIN